LFGRHRLTVAGLAADDRLEKSAVIGSELVEFGQI
jgi:hypothetical protein